MKIRTALTGCAVIACLLTVGCYNNPHTSEKKPGEGPQNIHAAPAVGPGTTAGGSTAGPQPAAQAKADHAAPAQADSGHTAETPKAPATH